MAVATMLAGACADWSRGRETPGLWAITRAAIGAQVPQVDVSRQAVEQAIGELARMGKVELAERLIQAAR